MPSSDQIIATFLRRVGTGPLDDVRALLLAVPALVNAVGPHPFWGGRPQALHVAIESGRRDTFDLLLENGANVNGVNDGYDLWSPLMLAINRERTEMRDELMRRGARVGLLEALMLGDDQKVEPLLAGDTLPEISPNGGSLLAFARTTRAIDRLLALGAKTEVKGVEASPAEYARLGDLETLTRLAAENPSVSQLDSVMMAAVDFRHYDVVQWLLANGGNPNARDEARSKQTALHSAAWNGDLRMVQMLVAAGADPSARDEQYDGTPLGFAETAIEVTNNPKCSEVAAYLTSLG
jgi:ankyrin repeat protein